MGAEMIFIRSAVGLEAHGEDSLLTLGDRSQALCRTVVIAAGVTYRRLEVPGLDELLGAGVFYGVAVTEGAALEGQQAFVIGGANSAGQAAVHLARFASQVTLLVRGPSLSASMSAYLIHEIERASNIRVWHNSMLTGVHGHGRLEAISVRRSATDSEQIEPADGLFVLIGADPHSDWLADTVEGLSPHWSRSQPLASGPTAAVAGDQYSGCFRRWRRTPWLGEARSLSRR
jgi:thioredoxin reductase (NADPH)